MRLSGAGGRAGRLIFRAHLDIEQLDLSMQMAALDLQVFRGSRNIPVMLPQFARNKLLFKGIAGIAKRVIGLGQAEYGRIGRLALAAPAEWLGRTCSAIEA